MKPRTVTDQGEECARIQEENDYLKRKMYRLQADMAHREKLEDLNRLLLKNALMELDSARERAEIASNAKTAFLANMSHEIRTPLNIILGMSELLESTHLSSKQRQFVTKGQEAGHHLLGLINNILEFSRIEKGSITLESQPFDLKQLVANLAGVYETLCEQKRLEFEFECDTRLSGFYLGDESKIQQILHNMLGNAIKFTHKGGVRFSVFLGEDAPDTVVFQVADSGIGISEKYQRYVFERFNQVERTVTKSHQGGVGLGLAIAKLLVEKMAGKIGLDSAVGYGSTFTIELPLQEVRNSSAATFDVRSQAVDRPELAGMSVLVVDDVPGNLYVVEHYLEDLGIDVTYAGGGRKAIELCTTKQFDLVLMDICMPEVDGITAFKAIRGHEADNRDGRTPIVAMTAHAFQEIRTSLHTEGFDGILTKPFSRSDLLATLSGSYEAEGAPVPLNHDETTSDCCEFKVPASLEPLIPMLMESLTAEQERIAKALETEQYSELVKLCHATKGVAGMYGFRRLAHMLENLELTVRKSEYAKATQLVSDLTEYIASLEKVFSAPPENAGS